MTGDTGLVSGAPWVLGRKEDEESLTLMPDYGFWSWPEPGVGSFLEVQDKTQLYETKLTWAKKKAKLFWRGALLVDIRKELFDIAKEHKWGEWSIFNAERRAIVVPRISLPSAELNPSRPL